MNRSPLHQHLKAAGSISRTNPELLRLHQETGLSLDHLFKIATGKRQPSMLAARAIEQTAGIKL